jgi:hypothetical protein
MKASALTDPVWQERRSGTPISTQRGEDLGTQLLGAPNVKLAIRRGPRTNSLASLQARVGPGRCGAKEREI